VPRVVSAAVATEAILLVGGMGTRLRPLTVSTPKPMLPVAGVPFVAHQLARLADAGIRHVVLATSYKAEVFAGYLGDGAGFGLEIEYATEAVPLGTGGAIRNVAERLRGGPDDPVVVLNGDVLSGHDLAAELALHVAADAAVTLYLTRVADPRAYGCVPTDASGRVTAFLEKMPEPVTDQINAGCYVFRRSIIDAIPAGEVVSVERATFPELVASGAVVLGFGDDAYWLDVGTPAALVQGSRDLVLGRLHSSALDGLAGVPGECLLLPGSSVSADARVGGGSVVGAGARVEAGAEVSGSVLLDGAVVGAGARVVDSVVAAGAQVGELASVRAAVVGDRAVVGDGARVEPGARVWTDQVLAAGTVWTSDVDPTLP
jgi:mannose-1-phosphate guanylyltransferase